MPEIRDFIAVGKIAKPIGLKGNLKVISLTDFPERFHKLKKVKLYNEKSGEFVLNNMTNEFDFRVLECRNHDSYLNVELDGVDDIESAEKLRDNLLVIDESERVKLTEGRYYIFELIGCGIYDNDVFLGEVESVVNYGSDDLFSIKSGGKEILIPFNDIFVKKVDTDKKRIDVNLIDGF